MSGSMLTPPEALDLVLASSHPLKPVKTAIADALGCVLAEDIRTRYAMPRFDNSAMDGYALRAADTRRATAEQPVALRLRATIYAGDTRSRALARGDACGIMTGAPMPAGADTIIPVEQALTESGCLVVTSPVPRGRHVRRRGEEVARGTKLLSMGDAVHPGTIACLAASGRARARVIPGPAVTVIATGNETVQPGRALQQGQIYDSNSHALAAALEGAGVRSFRRRHVKDRPATIEREFREALQRSDIVLITGGVSVGERDYVRDILRRLRVREVFWRVAQKPGKPLYFGLRGRRLVFGLPGNPASAFTCFYIYVYPALRRLAGFPHAGLEREAVPVIGGCPADDERWLFLKARRSARGVKIVRGQGSHMIATLATADRMVMVPPGRQPEVLRLPWAREPVA